MTARIAALTVVVVLAGAAMGDTVTDGFDAGISADLWTVVQTHPLWTVSAPDAEGRLEIHKPADTDYATGAQHIKAGVSSRFLLQGDFTVSVAFTLLDLPPAGLGYNETILGVRIPNADALFQCLHFVINSDRYAEGWGTHPTDVPVGQVADMTDQGRYEIRRDGQTVSAWIDRGSGSVLLGSKSDPAYLGLAKVELLGAQIVRPTGYRSFSALDVRYDDFHATADVIVPEPAALSLLALGGIVALRRRR